MGNIFLKPGRNAEGETLLVRDPTSRVPLPEEGAWKPGEHPFWQRRLRDRDVVDATEEQAATYREQPHPAAPAERPPSPQGGGMAPARKR